MYGGDGLKFLAITDLHYSDKPLGGNGRYHEMSLPKLREALGKYSEGCEFAVCLGDIADAADGYKPQAQGLEELGEVWRGFDIPFYAMIGNHDTAMDKRDFCRLTGMPHRYYSVETHDYLCLMLDTNMNSPDEPYPENEIKWAYCYIDNEQLDWAKEKISASDKPVIIFTHALLEFDIDEGERNDHVLVNADDVKQSLLFSDKVRAVFSGHYHSGLSMTLGNVPYVVFTSMCNEPTNNFAVVEIENGTVSVKGYGTQKDIFFE
ncbi:MAG: metallophosphoesterase [Clostridia bacterium]|nr:metallophosphoesterase [Clostridia bacterium]